MTFEESPNTTPKQPDVERIRGLGRMIRQKRISERLTLERASEQSGVSAATLSRLERQAEKKTHSTKGFIMPDTRTIANLVRWLKIALDDVLESTAPKAEQAALGAVEVGASTPDVIATYLRADRNLSPEAAQMLVEMFRLAYEQYSQLSDPKRTSEPSSSTGDNTDQPSTPE